MKLRIINVSELNIIQYIIQMVNINDIKMHLKYFL